MRLFAHSTILSRAICNALSTDLALFTYPQIIDGLPTADVTWDRRFSDLFGEHPIEQHEELCPGVMERAGEFRRGFDPSVLSFDSKAMDLANPTRLIEVVAVALHEIGVLLFQIGLHLHHGDIATIDQWAESPHDTTLAPRPTLFSHHGYLHSSIYPDGVASIVGYWAEDRILGGVTVFDRSMEEVAPDSPPNVHFHPCRSKVTKRYCQLRDDQQQALPNLADKTNTVRVNQEDAMLNNSYRDIWERVPPTARELDIIRRKTKKMWRIILSMRA